MSSRYLSKILIDVFEYCIDLFVEAIFLKRINKLNTIFPATKHAML